LTASISACWANAGAISQATKAITCNPRMIHIS
jgi:hypothetical protein